MRIGLVTDAHYHIVNYPDVRDTAVIAGALFKAEGVHLILGLGDMYDDFDDLAQAEVMIPTFESVWLETGINTKFVMGNHDKQGIGYAGYLANSVLTPAKNFTVDIENYRFICYANVDDVPGYPLSAGTDTLAWLTAELAKCQTGGIDAAKKVIICTHAYIYQDYPGDPPWYTMNPYSVFSFNSADQRAIIEAAKLAGANIKCVWHGHAHVNRDAIVNGIQYYGFASMAAIPTVAIIDIDANDNIRIIGTNGQSSYNNLPYYYVSPSGDDVNNKGLLRSLPWKTITKFTSSGSVADKKLTVMAGTYRETVAPSMTGAAGHPIIFDFEAGSKISGANIVTGFSLVGAEYQVALATECKVVIKDGVMLTEGTAGSLATGQWDWVTGVLYLKDDPTGHTIEAGQRNTGMSVSTATQYVVVNNPHIYGCNNNSFEPSGTPLLTVNNPTIEMGRFGVGDSSTSVGGGFIVNNPTIRNNKATGLLFSGSSTGVYRNVKASGNVTGISVSGTAAPKITGGLITGNGTGINLVTTGGAGTVIANVITKGNTTKGVNSTGAGTTEIKNSCINETTNTWGSTTQTAIITSDPLVNSDGLLQYGSPCIDTGAWVSGVGGNQSGETDRYGNKVYGIPNIGIDQKSGMPISGNSNSRGIGSSRNFH